VFFVFNVYIVIWAELHEKILMMMMMMMMVMIRLRYPTTHDHPFRNQVRGHAFIAVLFYSWSLMGS